MTMSVLSTIHQLVTFARGTLETLLYLAAAIFVFVRGRDRGVLPGIGLSILFLTGLMSMFIHVIFSLEGVGDVIYNGVTNLLMIGAWALIVIGLFRRYPAAPPTAPSAAPPLYEAPPGYPGYPPPRG